MIPGFKTYTESADIYADLRIMLQNAQKSFLALGVSFDRSIRNLGPHVDQALQRGVHFTFLALSRNANLGMVAQRFGQGPEELLTEIESSYAVLEAYRRKHPNQFNVYFMKLCPCYRLYAVDLELETSPGIINFYGTATDSPHLPAFKVDNFKTSDFAPYYNDAVKTVKKAVRNKIFIIHGHNEGKWRELDSLLRDMGLEPVVLVDQPDGGSTTVIEKFEKYARDCSFAVAVFTPDDWVDSKGKKYFQPRPNAVFEVGWFCAHLGRTNVLVLSQGEMLTFSDFQGVIQKKFQSSVKECWASIQAEFRRLELIRD
jgi:predicted nucleotide-binding protein